MRKSSIGNLWVVAGIIAVGVIVSGCASVGPMASSSAGPRTVAVGPRSTAADGAIAAVRSLPAFRDARIAYVKKALEKSGAEDRPYIFKTALQMQLYGNPNSRL